MPISNNIKSCAICKKTIDLSTEYDGSYALINNRYYHCDCWTNHKTALKSGAWSVQRCKDYLVKFQGEAKEKSDEIFYYVKLLQFLLSFFNCKIITTQMSEILKKVNSGTFRDYSTIISNKELYKLFTSQEEMLYQCNSKLKRQNALKGKNTEPNQLLAYDIVILLSNYDKYSSSLYEDKAERTHIDYQNIFKHNSTPHYCSEVDISTMIDDI